mmetsp:Transcript_66999/g.139897  ORF Transcript_66999/g.139897 Transcript_66999/m.139897 type:complete len:213 (+) Transcript_66999:99-737(+)
MMLFGSGIELRHDWFHDENRGAVVLVVRLQRKKCQWRVQELLFLRIQTQELDGHSSLEASDDVFEDQRHLAVGIMASHILVGCRRHRGHLCAAQFGEFLDIHFQVFHASPEGCLPSERLWIHLRLYRPQLLDAPIQQEDNHGPRMGLDLSSQGSIDFWKGGRGIKPYSDELSLGQPRQDHFGNLHPLVQCASSVPCIEVVRAQLTTMVVPSC